MATVHLQFPSLVYLSAFRQTAKAADWQIDLATMSLQCKCSPKVLHTALTDFHARWFTEDRSLGQERAAVA